MAAYFFDTSGIVKRYIQETGTSWVQAVADPGAGHQVYLARIAAVEVASAVTRRQRSGALSASEAAAIMAQFRKDMSFEYRVIEITPPLLSSAMLLAGSHALRAYDAVQLAVAAELHAQRAASGLSPLTLISADHDINVAAANLGMMVEDPNLH